ncbi:MAG TPA: hypothetical protein VGN52_20975 [Burkholderiales bacterium]
MARAVAFILLFLLLLAGVGFLMRDQEPVRGWLPREWRGAPTAPPAQAKSNPITPSHPAGVRKCKRGAEVLYTSGDCPAGSSEQSIERGAVNVLPAPGGNAQNAGASGGASGSETATDKLGEAMGRDRARETRERGVDRATR